MFCAKCWWSKSELNYLKHQEAQCLMKNWRCTETVIPWMHRLGLLEQNSCHPKASHFILEYNALPACNENSINVGWCSILKYFRKTVRLALFTQHFDLELYKLTSFHLGVDLHTLLFPIPWDLRNGEKAPLPSFRRSL